MRFPTLAGIIALALIATACDVTPATEPETDVLRATASTNESVSPVTETTYSATLVDFELVDHTVLPSGTVITESNTYWESTGDWEGTFVGDNTQTNHKNGVVTGKAEFTFDGSVLGSEGTLEIRFQATTKADGTFKGRATILSGTGELANLRGHGTNVATAPDQIEGTVFVHFAP